MSLSPPTWYRKTRGINRRGTRALQPAYSDVLEGTLYFVTDEFKLERAGSAGWQDCSSAGAAQVNSDWNASSGVAEILNLPGAWISFVYSAGIFTASGTMTWTVDSGDVVTLAYQFLGKKTALVAFELQSTSIGGTPDQFFIVTLPAPLTPTKTMRGTMLYSDNAGALTLGQWTVFSGTGAIYLYKLVGNWSASVNSTRVVGSALFEIN